MRWNEIGTCSYGLVIGGNLTNESIYGGHDHPLSLSYNKFGSSQIPSRFDMLMNLSYLDSSNAAAFAGQIPIEISRLTRLVTYTQFIQESDPN